MYLFQLGGNITPENIALFTFHYVSISTQSPDIPQRSNIHLHSTMYLFQPTAKIRRQILS